MKRLLALVLSFIMTLSMFPTMAFAEGTCEHSYGEGVVTPPTCTDQGYTTYTCTLCGDSYQDNFVEKKGHAWTNEIKVAPTCYTAGTRLYTCSVCNATETAHIDPTGEHTWSAEGEVVTPATCYADGKMKYTCTFGECTTTKEEAITERPEHTWPEEGTVVTPSTCTVEGTIKYTCTVDGCDEEKEDKLPLADHTIEIIPGKEATVTETGLTDGEKCSVCGEVLVEQEVIPVIPTEDSGKCGPELNWSLAEGVLTISGSGEMYTFNTDDLLPPWYHSRSLIEEVVIKDGATTISDYAFAGCSNLTSLTMPFSMKIIGEGAFEGATSIKSLHIEKGVTTIHHKAFKDSGVTNFTVDGANANYYAYEGVLYNNDDLETLVYYPAARAETEFSIPYGVKTIGEYAFYGSKNLTKVNINETVTAIKANAFAESALTELDIHKRMVSIDPLAFAQSNLTGIKVDKNNTKYMDQDGVLYSKDSATPLWYEKGTTLLWYPDCLNGEFVIPDVTVEVEVEGKMEDVTVKVTTIGEHAFEGSKVKAVTVPESVIDVKNYAFKDSTVENIYFMGNKPTIRSYAFENIKANAWYWSIKTGWDSITKNPGSDSYKYGAEEITWKIKDEVIDETKIIGKTREVEVDGVLTNVQDKVYWEYYAEGNMLKITGTGEMMDFTAGSQPWAANIGDIQRVYIEKTVTNVGANAFKDCVNLKEIYLPASGAKNSDVFIIGANAFSGCTAIESISLPRHLTVIGEGAFEGCTGIKNIVLPSKVTTIGADAFNGCSALKGINLPITVTSIGERAFMGCAKLKAVGMTSSSSDYALTTIGNHAFAGCEELESILLPSKLETIGDLAFHGCKKLAGITLPTNLTLIGEGAFYGCEAITSINIRSKAVIGVSAFEACTGLTKVVISSRSTTLTDKTPELKEIPYRAFADCTALKEVSVGSGITTIGGEAFSGCVKLDNLTLPESVQDVYKLDENDEVTDEIESFGIAEDAFADCDSLKTAKYGTSGANYNYGWKGKIPANAFRGLEFLTTLELPSGIKEIHDTALEGCIGLTDITGPTANSAGNFVSLDGVLCAKVKVDSKTIYELYRYPAGRIADEYVVPDSVVVIGEKAFYQNQNLKYITFQESVTELKANVFAGSQSIAELDFVGDAPVFDENAFSGLGDVTAYYVRSKAWPAEALQQHGATGTITWSPVKYVIEIDKPEPGTEIVAGETIKVNFVIKPSAVSIDGQPFTVHIYDADGYPDTKTEVRYFDTPKVTLDNKNGTITLTALDTVADHKDVIVELKSDELNANVQSDFFGLTVIPKVKKLTIYRDGHDYGEKYMEGETEKDNPAGYQDKLDIIYAESNSQIVKTIIVDRMDYNKDNKNRDYQFVLRTFAEPEKAIQDVEWESSNSSIASVKKNEDGSVTITLRNQGEATITARSTENASANKNIYARVKLDVIFVDKAEDLTAKTDAPSVGLPVGEEAQIMVFGEDKDQPLDSDKFEYIYNGSVIEVDELGHVTALEEGTATVSIRIFGGDKMKTEDGEERTASVSIKVIPVQVKEVFLRPEVNDTERKSIVKYLDKEGKDITYDSNRENDVASYAIAIERNSETGKGLLKGGYQFKIIPTLTNANGVDVEPDNKVIKYTSSNTAIASVTVDKHGVATVTIKESANGACTITGTATDASKKEGYLSIYVKDHSPRLVSNKLTLNPYLEAGVSAQLLSSYGNDIIADSLELYEYNSVTKEYDIRLDSETLERNEDGTVKYPFQKVDYNSATEEFTVKAWDAKMKNKSYKVQLVVDCSRDGNAYDVNTYKLNLTISTKASLPSVTVKQAEKLDLFYTDSKAAVSVTSKNAEISGVELKQYKSAKDESEYKTHETFAIDGAYQPDEGIFKVKAINAKECYEAKKPDTKSTLLINLVGYRVPVEKSFTVGTTKTALKLTTQPTSSTVHSIFGSDEVSFNVYNSSIKKTVLVDKLVDVSNTVTNPGYSVISAIKDIIPKDPSDPESVDHEYTVITLNVAGLTKSTTAKLSVQATNWAAPVEVSHKITVQTSEPSVKLGTTTLKLNNKFVDQAAETTVTLSQVDVDITKVVFATTATDDAKDEADKLDVVYDTATGVVKASIKEEFKAEDKVPKKGSYTFKGDVYVTGEGVGEHKLKKQITVKVSVSDTIPKVTLGSTSLSLNILLRENLEKGYSLAKLSAKDIEAGYKVVGFKEINGIWNTDYIQLTTDTDADGNLYLCANLRKPHGDYEDKYDKSYSFTLTPIVADAQGTEVEVKTVKLTVKPYKSGYDAWSATASGKGSLDATQRLINLPDVEEVSEIVYTVTKLSNVVGRIQDVNLTSKDADASKFELVEVDGKKFELNNKDQAVIRLRLKEDEVYNTNETYTVKLALTMEGMKDSNGDAFKVETDYLDIKVGQTPLKVKAKTIQGNIYQSQNLSKIPAVYELTMSAPEYGKLNADSVKLNTEDTSLQVLNAFGKKIVTVDGEDKLVWNDVKWIVDPDGKGGRIEVRLKDTSKLVAGKSYTIYVDVEPEGNAADVDPVKVKLTLKVPK